MQFLLSNATNTTSDKLYSWIDEKIQNPTKEIEDNIINIIELHKFQLQQFHAIQMSNSKVIVIRKHA